MPDIDIHGIAKRTGYSIHHLRFLSAAGELPSHARNAENGARLYRSKDIDLWFNTYVSNGPHRRPQGPRKKRRRK